MVTKYYKLNNKNIWDQSIDEIVSAYKKGEVIAFPTETVYGLGADIENEAAIKKIFLAKKRPGDNPLIAHIGKMEDVGKVAAHLPKKAERLMEAFWPGPLTIVLKKKEGISDLATANLKTIGIRMADSPILESILVKGDLILVAPSANISGSPSPTSFNHVKNDLEDLIYGIIDGGDCEEGIESTIIDLSEERPVILRPGTIIKEEIEEEIGKVELDGSFLGQEIKKPKAPGMKYKHYAPKAKVYIIKEKESVKNIEEEIEELAFKGVKTAVVAFRENLDNYKGLSVGHKIVLGGKKDLKEGIRNLYRILRDCDILGIENIFIEETKEEGLGFSYMNRLKKAGSHNFLKRS